MISSQYKLGSDTKSLFAVDILFICISICIFISHVSSLNAQVDLRISGPQSGIPIALPQFCDLGDADSAATSIPATILKDLEIAGIFNVIPPASYIESPGKCPVPGATVFSDWSVIGAEGLVKGSVQEDGDMITAELYLFDVSRQKAVLAKRYQTTKAEVNKVAHKFANEIMKFFTGIPGVFGTRITFVTKAGRYKELAAMDLDGANYRQLTNDKGIVVSPNWSPNGDRIVYTSYRTRKPDLYIMNANGTNARQITNSPSMELGVIFSIDGGALLGSSSVTGTSNLVVFDLNGRIVRNITGGSSIDISPTYAPDGNRIAFCSNRSGGPQIYVANSSGSGAQRVSFAKSNYCTSPTWSPKEEKLAFVCRSGGFQLYLANADGSNVIQLTYEGNNEDPSFSPDGRYLVFSTTSYGGRNLAVISLSNGKIKQISFGRGDDGQPSWGPLVD